MRIADSFCFGCHYYYDNPRIIPPIGRQTREIVMEYPMEIFGMHIHLFNARYLPIKGIVSEALPKKWAFPATLLHRWLYAITGGAASVAFFAMCLPGPAVSQVAIQDAFFLRDSLLGGGDKFNRDSATQARLARVLKTYSMLGDKATVDDTPSSKRFFRQPIGFSGIRKRTITRPF
jgi:hypothetical protein